MEWITATLQIALGAGLATTFDDNIYLTGFFGEVNRTFRPRHVVAGEFLGFTLLLIISLIGFAAGLVLPQNVIGLLGVMPILIGIMGMIQYWQSRGDRAENQQASSLKFSKLKGFQSREPSFGEVLMDRQTYNVSVVSISNGSNNLSIYIPLFASLSLLKIAIVIPVLYGFIATWLFLSFQLTRAPGIALVLNRYARAVFPFILIWLGYRILSDTGAIALLLPHRS
jgi:cadmium resistance protein CadD (predicted permease)